jgi:hypothetical protein
VWRASGATADVNALLAGLTFTPAADFNGSFTIATSVSDGVAAPVTGSKTITSPDRCGFIPQSTRIMPGREMTRIAPTNLPSFDSVYQRHTGVLDTLKAP